jgi:hypothetical protein
MTPSQACTTHTRPAFSEIQMLRAPSSQVTLVGSVRPTMSTVLGAPSCARRAARPLASTTAEKAAAPARGEVMAAAGMGGR